MIYWTISISVCSFLASAFGVAAVRRWTLSRNVIDVPNERSSHRIPTPRGGGILIFLTGLAAYSVYGTATGAGISWGFAAGAVMIAIVSFLDDLGHVPVLVRLGVHTAAAALVVADTGGFSSLVPYLGWTVYPVSVVWIVWLVNAYNFMDGIDGIAGVQAVTAGAGYAAIGWIAGEPHVSVLGAALAAGSLGFLVHNWAPARIFMGDVGAAFLGFAFGAVPFLGRGTGSDSLESVAVFPIWFFMLDSVFTLFRRLVRGERVWRAHREHIYQRLVIAGMSHGSVTLIYGTLSAAISGAAALMLAIPAYPISLLWALTAVPSAVLAVLLILKTRRADFVS